MRNKLFEYIPYTYTLNIEYKNGNVDTFENCDSDFTESFAENYLNVLSDKYSEGLLYIEWRGRVKVTDINEVSKITVYDNRSKEYTSLSYFIDYDTPGRVYLVITERMWGTIS